MGGVQCTTRVEELQETPRAFFMDVNIKDFTTLNPFTHVYAFQVGSDTSFAQFCFAILHTVHHRKDGSSHEIGHVQRAIWVGPLGGLCDLIVSSRENGTQFESAPSRLLLKYPVAGRLRNRILLCLQIGMPADVVNHIFRLLATSASVKYVIAHSYPHFAVHVQC